MPLGIKQNNDFNSLTLDLWQDKVFYQEREFPAGYFAAEILNLTEEDLQQLSSCGGAPTHILPLLEYKDAQLTARVLPALRRQMEELFERQFINIRPSATTTENWKRRNSTTVSMRIRRENCSKTIRF